ncbi:cation diffusion facilitator family transporter [Candidatus Riflebacteria bacterium]
METCEHGHDHSLKEKPIKALFIALGITSAFLMVEIIGGYLSNSLALLADAGHMFTDVFSLGMAILAWRIAQRPRSKRKTFGYQRTETLGAFLNTISLFAICGFIVYESIHRLNQPREISSGLMITISVLGLIANILSAMVLFESAEKNMNVHGAYLHVIADALGSIAAIIAGTVIHFTGWTSIDPLVSLIITGIILYGSIKLFSKSSNLLLQGIPEGLDFNEIRESLKSLTFVKHVHDLHIWGMGQNEHILTVHLEVESQSIDEKKWLEYLSTVNKTLQAQFGIEHSTIQIEPSGYKEIENKICN